MFGPGLRPRFTIAVSTLLFLPSALVGQTSAQMEPEVARAYDFHLTIESIMRGPEHVGSAPSGIRWSVDSEWIYFQWLPGGGAWDDSPELYRIRASGGEPERVPDEMADSVSLFTAGGDLSRDGRTRVASIGGDLYLIETEPFRARRLTETDESEGSPVFSEDEQAVFFTKG